MLMRVTCLLCAALGLQLFPEPEYEDDEEELGAEEDAEPDEEDGEEEGSVAGG